MASGWSLAGNVTGLDLVATCPEVKEEDKEATLALTPIAGKIVGLIVVGREMG